MVVHSKPSPIWRLFGTFHWTGLCWKLMLLTVKSDLPMLGSPTSTPLSPLSKRRSTRVNSLITTMTLLSRVGTNHKLFSRLLRFLLTFSTLTYLHSPTKPIQTHSTFLILNNETILNYFIFLLYVIFLLLNTFFIFINIFILNQYTMNKNTKIFEYLLLLGFCLSGLAINFFVKIMSKNYYFNFDLMIFYI